MILQVKGTDIEIEHLQGDKGVLVCQGDSRDRHPDIDAATSIIFELMFFACTQCQQETLRSEGIYSLRERLCKTCYEDSISPHLRPTPKWGTIFAPPSNRDGRII